MPKQTDRDELAWEIFRVDNAAVPDDVLRPDFPREADYAIHIAEGLLAAGYRKVVTKTVEIPVLPGQDTIDTALGV